MEEAPPKATVSKIIEKFLLYESVNYITVLKADHYVALFFSYSSTSFI
jgi:hypothetical protein